MDNTLEYLLKLREARAKPCMHPVRRIHFQRRKVRKWIAKMSRKINHCVAKCSKKGYHKSKGASRKR